MVFHLFKRARSGRSAATLPYGEAVPTPLEINELTKDNSPFGSTVKLDGKSRTSKKQKDICLNSPF